MKTPRIIISSLFHILRFFRLLKVGAITAFSDFKRMTIYPFAQYQSEDLYTITYTIVKARYNGISFTAGNGFNQFWIRDFAIFSEYIDKLGFKEQVKNTLSWALKNYYNNRHVSTTLYSNGSGHDVFHYSADSLPLLLFALHKTSNTDLLLNNSNYIRFLNQEILQYYNVVFDPHTNTVKKNRVFSTPKDMLLRSDTATATIFIAFLQRTLDKFEGILINPFKGIDIVSALIERYWEGSYFINDREDSESFFSSDPNVLAYWTKVITDDKMKKSSLSEIKKRQLDEPIPLAYHEKYNPKHMLRLVRFFSPNYQGNSKWLFLAPLYIELEASFAEFLKDAKRHINTISELTLKSKTFYEVLEPGGDKPLKGRFGYSSKDGMLWIAQMPFLEEYIEQLLNANNELKN